MKIYLVRHAQSRQNVNENERNDHPFPPEVAEYEDGDFSLTFTGHLQADKAGLRLTEKNFTAVLCSPMHRTVATAYGIMKHQRENHTVELINDLVERGIYNYSGMPLEILQGLYPEMDIRPCPDPTPTGGKFTYTLEEMYDPAELTKRARRVVKYVEERFDHEDTILIVSHGDFLGRYLIPSLLHIPDGAIEQFNTHGFGCGNASISKIVYNKNDGTSFLAFLNDTVHLQDGHETAKIN